MDPEDNYKLKKDAVQWVYGTGDIYFGFCTLCEHAPEATVNAYYKLLMHYSDIRDMVNRKW